MRPLVEAPPGARRTLFAGGILALAVWSGGGLGLLSASLPPAHGTRIPFGESGFGDGLTCLGCARDGQRWRGEIAEGSSVILIDSDGGRENPTAPGGLRLYGTLAAYAAGKPERFIDLYSALRNVDRETMPPNVLQLYPNDTKSPLTYLDAQIRNGDAETIVWEFRTPTSWELALANRLLRAGGTLAAVVAPPLGMAVERRPQGSPPFQVRTTRARWPETRQALEQFLSLDPEHGCAILAKKGSGDQDNDALSVLGAEPATAAAPRWIVGSWDFVSLGTRKLTVQEPVALGIETQDGSAPVMRLLDRYGGETRIVNGTAALRTPVPALPARIGHACAAFARGTWWVVDGLGGRLSAVPAPPWPLPQGGWTGIAASGDLLFLASGEQEIQVLDTGSGAIVRRFPAVVPPPWGLRLGDCSPIAVGNGWVATLSPQAARLTIQDLAGKLLVREDLTKLLPSGTTGAYAPAAQGDYLAVGHLNHVDALEVRRMPGCGEDGG